MSHLPSLQRGTQIQLKGPRIAWLLMKPPVGLRYMLGIQDPIGAGIGNALREMLSGEGSVD